MLGKDFIIYTTIYPSGDVVTNIQWQPIGCGTTCTLSMTAEELITTTKGSGRATNRETGRTDWQITSSEVVIGGNVAEAPFMIDPLRKGSKIIIKGAIDGYAGNFFGQAVITAIEFTGAAEGFLTANVTIKADGPLYLPPDLETGWDQPGYFEKLTTGTTTTLTDAALFQKTIAFIVVDDRVDAGFTFDNDNGSSQGVITFDNPGIPTGKLIQVYFYS